MRVFDLGPRHGPMLAFGGPYSNLHALRAMRGLARAENFDKKSVICTGDVVAYGSQPRECVAEMRKWGITCVAGNCELQLAAGADSCGCGFTAGSLCDALSAGWYGYANDTLTEVERTWMAACPDLVVFTMGGRRYVVLHGGASAVAEFLWHDSPVSAFAQEVAMLEDVLGGPIDAVIAGHSGVPFRRRVAGVDWINAGVIGMPAHDGTAATRFAVIHPTGDVDQRELLYDAQAAHDHMVAKGLTQGYHTALLSGWWPSEDVLPHSLRRIQGVAE
ncbi:metallophosphoesterase family protein [Allosediminivita pacifica]|uniref:Calcineurin-like phosphoesterase family protein n=1 Tax=Allosediminivita pacifica TaxID=1267769 RepID=A0A2T6AY80_9RHOB|nr:metallophosphoesterase family protein [Allosediminivita pacifica]PTX48774.1 calcineurin-like phosphoesterase family protein [Allosediminivita pacifica]GGB08110.1 hypothetical protein GCM10011324_17860 [Allosediminivita pacifica]